MATAPTPRQVIRVRDDLALAGIPMREPTDAMMISRVIEHVQAGGGDEHIAVLAILMEPRPSWLRELIGSDLMAGS